MSIKKIDELSNEYKLRIDEYKSEIASLQSGREVKEAHAKLLIERRATSFFKIKAVNIEGGLEAIEIGYDNKHITITRDELMQRAKDGDILCSMVVEKLAKDKLLGGGEPPGQIFDTSSMDIDQARQYLGLKRR